MRSTIYLQGIANFKKTYFQETKEFISKREKKEQ